MLINWKEKNTQNIYVQHTRPKLPCYIYVANFFLLRDCTRVGRGPVLKSWHPSFVRVRFVTFQGGFSARQLCIEHLVCRFPQNCESCAFVARCEKWKGSFVLPFCCTYIHTRIEQRKVSLKLSSLSRNRARHCFYAACVKSCFFLHPLLLLHCCLACWRARLYFYDVFVVFHSQII
jgi:hypothetical protein